MTAYAADTWLCPIVIDSTNNVIVITEDPAGIPLVITATIDVGTYYLHDDSSFHATRKGLLYTIATLLTDGTTAGLGTVTGASANTYTFAVADPSSSTGLANNGLQMLAVAATDDWEVTWTGATTIDAQWFGSILAAPLLDDASTTSGADEVFTWPHATRYRMCTRDLGDGFAVDKRRSHYKDAKRSSPRPSDSVSVVWQEGYIRRIRYQDVPGVEVHQNRATASEWAAWTTRSTTDIKATWFDVWDALTDDLRLVIVHDSTGDFQVDTHDYEVVKAWDSLDWDSFAVQVNPSGDMYDLTIPVWVDTSESDYDH